MGISCVINKFLFVVLIIMPETEKGYLTIQKGQLVLKALFESEQYGYEFGQEYSGATWQCQFLQELSIKRI